MKKFLISTILILLLFSSISYAFIDTEAETAIVIDASTGLILYEKNKDIKNYSKKYHRSLFFSSHKGSYQNYVNYKNAIFSVTDSPEIKMSNLNIVQHKSSAIITFIQHYKSRAIKDSGKKTLHLRNSTR